MLLARLAGLLEVLTRELLCSPIIEVGLSALCVLGGWRVMCLSTSTGGAALSAAAGTDPPAQASSGSGPAAKCHNEPKLAKRCTI